MNPEAKYILSRREFLILGVALTTRTVFPKKNESLSEEWSSVTVRAGDCLSTLCAFFGIRDWMAVAKANKIPNPDLIFPGQNIFLPVPQEKIDFPLKKIFVPKLGLSTSITNNEEYFAKSVQGAPDFPYFHSQAPYALFGHSHKIESLGGVFNGIRDLEPNDPLWLSRTFDGKDGEWLKGKITLIKKTTTKEEVEKLLSSLNSQMMALITCFVETPNEDDRLVAFFQPKEYFAKAPPIDLP